MMANESRRGFLTKAAMAGPAVVAFGAASVATAGLTAPGRRSVAGAPSAPFSRAVIHGDLAYVSGVVGHEKNNTGLSVTDFGRQCRQAFTNLQASVEAAGSSLQDVLQCTCFLTDASDFPKLNIVWRRFFASAPPARSTVVVKALVVPGAKIEVDCVTALLPRR